MIAWDWGWQDDWSQPAIAAMPTENGVMSVVANGVCPSSGAASRRGGGVFDLGDRPGTAGGAALEAAQLSRHADPREAAGRYDLGAWFRPLSTGDENVAEHMRRLRAANVDGVMLGWTLGGYPSPNLETASRVLAGESPAASLQATATRRFGSGARRRGAAGLAGV